MIRCASLFLLAQVALCLAAFGQSVLGPSEERIIQYEAATNLQDPVAMLQRLLASGKARLDFDPARGYLPSLLKALDVRQSSQALVFSRSSSQADQTSPHSPRAVYFSDQVSLGWVPKGTNIDLIAIDPRVGPVFYTLPQQPARVPRFERRTDCMGCHLGPRTSFVPGLVVRSFYTAADGTLVANVANFVNGHNSPLAERWGGWYVTGTHPHELHLGNLFVSDSAQIDRLDLSRGANVTDLRPYFDTAPYLSRDSDMIALLVLEHQVRMQNLLTRANYETRYALDELSAPRPPNAIGSPDWPRQRIALAGEDLLQYMLFRDEALLHGPLKGTSIFARQFARIGPHASGGRSLRQFDLNSRLFRYPCSYLIYSPAFDALPGPMKEFLWTRLEQILSGNDHSPAYAAFAAPDRQAVFQILRETKPEFAAWLKDKRAPR
ncbi:MAG: hypothetical protein JWR26_296 [Pedosphaera sp.]|nr:hypothetical protein [Pedosphaera sp.]